MEVVAVHVEGGSRCLKAERRLSGALRYVVRLVSCTDALGALMREASWQQPGWLARGREGELQIARNVSQLQTASPTHQIKPADMWMTVFGAKRAMPDHVDWTWWQSLTGAQAGPSGAHSRAELRYSDNCITYGFQFWMCASCHSSIEAFTW